MVTKSSRLRKLARQSSLIVSGLILGWVLVELLLRLGFTHLPYPLRETVRHVYKSPFSTETILPAQIWQNDGDFQFISRNNIQNERQYPDSRIGFNVSTANWLDPNSQVGFRVSSNDWSPRWPVDVVAVGDSFTFCYTEYSACWVQRLSESYGLSTVNLGLVATGSVSHLHVLQTFGLPYEPRLVIWQWYGNDANDDYGFALQRGEIPDETYLPPQIAWTPANPLLKWLHQYSAAYRLLDTAFTSAERQTGVNRFADPHHVAEGGVDLWFGRSYTLASSDLDEQKNQFGLTQTEASLLQAQALLEEKGIQLLVILIPTKEEVYARLTEPLLESNYLQTVSQGRIEMIDFCQEQRINCLDTTPDLQDFANAGEQLFWSEDTHLNDLGNQRLAEIVWQSLQEISP